jgi:hypothetical protein
MTDPAGADLVFNIVWTGSVFTYLQYFVASQLDQSAARFRFVANGCPAEQVTIMEAWAERHPGRVVEVLDVSPDEMVAHGVALDRVRAIRDDGAFFCTIDPDIVATAPFLAEFAALLDEGADVVTSGTEVWSEDNLVPEGHPGVAGEHFFGRDGFVLGSPHLAIYRRAVLDASAERWGVGLGSAGPELRDDTRAHMASVGQTYLIYDTAKVVNVLIQADGHRLTHLDLPQLVHIGGLTHFLAPAYYLEIDDQVVPEWVRWDGVEGERFRVSRYAGELLVALCEDGPMPTVAPETSPAMADRLDLVRHTLTEMMARYGPG